jgi:hypothetical protein
MPILDRDLATAGDRADISPPCCCCHAGQGTVSTEDGKVWPGPARLAHLYLLRPRHAGVQSLGSGPPLSHVRRDSAREPGRQWVAVRKDQAQQIGAYVSVAEAAAALARTCGC